MTTLIITATNIGHSFASNGIDLKTKTTHLPAAMTRKSIELCIKGFIVALIFTFAIFFLQVLQMMGFGA